MTTETLRDTDASVAGSAISFINDNEQLEAFITAYKKKDKIKDHPGLVHSIRDALSSIKAVDLKFVKIDLPTWNEHTRISPRALKEFNYIVLREDRTEATKVAELIEIFRQTPALDQPQIVFVKNSHHSDMAARLRYAHPDISFVDLENPSSDVIQIARPTPTSSLDFLQLYDGRCFDRVAAVSTRDIGEWSDQTGKLADPLILGTRIRARLLTAERHDVEPEVDTLLGRIASMLTAAADTDMTALFSIRIDALIWKVYCSENPAYLTEAIALASALSDDLRLASCLRLAEFLDIHPALTQHMYERSERIFRSHGLVESALQCFNNRLVSGFSRTLYSWQEFARLVAEIESDQPALYRKHDVFYNSAVQFLLSGDLDKAQAIFRSEEMLSARPLVSTSSAVCDLVCDKVAGRQVDASAVVSATNMVIDLVPKSNRWHISNLLMNLILVAADDPDLRNSVKSLARPNVDLDSKSDVYDPLGENRRLGALAGLSRKRSHMRIPGPFGDFQERHGFAPPYYFIWS